MLTKKAMSVGLLAIGLSVMLVSFAFAQDKGPYPEGVGSYLQAQGVDLNKQTPEEFKRGDAITDGSYTMGDGLLILQYYIYGSPTPDCLDACDYNDDGSITMGDGLACLSYYIYGTPVPAPPGTACGPDPTTDDPYDCGWHEYCQGPKK
jgi:hypothetical protein